MCRKCGNNGERKRARAKNVHTVGSRRKVGKKDRERVCVCVWKSAPNTRFILHISCLSSRCVSFYFFFYFSRCYIVLTELLSGLTAFGILCTVVIPPTHNQIITKSGMYPHICFLFRFPTHGLSFSSERTNDRVMLIKAAINSDRYIRTQRSKYDEIWLCFSCNMKWSMALNWSKSERRCDVHKHNDESNTQHSQMVTTIPAKRYDNNDGNDDGVRFQLYYAFAMIWHTPNDRRTSITNGETDTGREYSNGKCSSFSQKHTPDERICWTRALTRILSNSTVCP